MVLGIIKNEARRGGGVSRILREVTAVLSAFLLALPSVQAVGEKNVRIAFVNEIHLIQQYDPWRLAPPLYLGWRSDDGAKGISWRNMCLLKSKKVFDSFLKAAAEKWKIIKVIKIPKPPADFIPNMDTVNLSSNLSEYLDLKTGEYRHDYFRDRTFQGYKVVSFEAGSRTYKCELYCYKVKDSEVKSINDKLIFRPYQDPPKLTTVKGFLIGGTVLAVIEAAGIGLCIGLCIKQNRKKEEERKKKLM
ncbi:MAG: hypothetical protein LBL71_01450 [Endomicrobium sp.]|jgi:hypothetical protein|nr:hypothetical protein [Endomicrobium sp.]